jgi:hypothetical protein
MKPARLLLCGDCGRKSLPPHAPRIARACRSSARAAAKPQIVAGLAGAFLAFAIHGASGMKIVPNGNQLILSGPVANGDLQKVADALSNSSSVNTIVLRNSPGGNIATGYRLGELFRLRGLRTALSGFCYSSCSRMFLGGKTRYFTDDYPAIYTHVGFHGHYDPKSGHLLPQQVQRYGLKAWIIKYSDGKADPALVERWISIPINIGLIHFYHPDLYSRGGVSTFMCQGSEPMAQAALGCEPVHKTALDLGIVTSLQIQASNDREEIRRGISSPPKGTGFAALEDTSKVPLVGTEWLDNYRKFLSSPLPRAFAISSDGRDWAWNAGVFDAIPKALGHCLDRSKLTCRLYAVDGEVVWVPKWQ